MGDTGLERNLWYRRTRGDHI